MKTVLVALLLLFVTAVNAQMESLEKMLVYEMPHSRGARKLTLNYYRYSNDGTKRDSLPVRIEHFILDNTGLVDTVFYISSGVYSVNLFTHDPATRFVKTYKQARGNSFSAMSLTGIDTFTYVKLSDAPLTVQRKATFSKHLRMQFVLTNADGREVVSNTNLSRTLGYENRYDEKKRKKTEKLFYDAVLENSKTNSYNQWDDITEQVMTDANGKKFRIIRYEYTYDSKGNWITQLETWSDFDDNNKETGRAPVYYVTREISY